jgi:hypothetical protein
VNTAQLNKQAALQQKVEDCFRIVQHANGQETRVVATARSKALTFLLENNFETDGITSFTKRETSVAVALGWQLALEFGVVDWIFELVVWGWCLGFRVWGLDVGLGCSLGLELVHLNLSRMVVGYYAEKLRHVSGSSDIAGGQAVTVARSALQSKSCIETNV